MASPRSRTRLAFIDAARAAAMLLMLQGHSADNLLVEAAKATPFFELYWRVRGVTAPLFLVLSGFALVVASDVRWEEYGRLGRPLARRLTRSAQILAVGFLLQMPRWTGDLPFDFTAAEWRHLFRSGVLQVIAVGLASAHALLAAFRSRRSFARAAVALGIALFALTPLLAQPWVRLPTGLSLLFTFDSGSIFPMAPSLGYFFFGLAAGRLFLDRPDRFPDARRFGAAVSMVGAALFAAGFLWDLAQPDPFVDRAHHVSAPSLLLMRLGGAFGVLAIFALALNEARSWRWLSFVSGRALSIYVAHLVVLYGPPAHFELGLIARVGATVPASRVFFAGPALFLVCVASVFLLSKVAQWMSGAWGRLGGAREVPSPRPEP